MFNGAPTRSDDAPLLWLELFDHDAQGSLDSCSFHEIDDAVSGFDMFIEQARKFRMKSAGRS